MVEKTPKKYIGSYCKTRTPFKGGRIFFTKQLLFRIKTQQNEPYSKDFKYENM